MKLCKQEEYLYELQQKLDKYADLIIKVGLNLQQRQLLLINTPLGTEKVIRKIVKQAYVVGAKNVYVDWYDEKN